MKLILFTITLLLSLNINADSLHGKDYAQIFGGAILGYGLAQHNHFSQNREPEVHFYNNYDQYDRANLKSLYIQRDIIDEKIRRLEYKIYGY